MLRPSLLPRPTGRHALIARATPDDAERHAADLLDRYAGAVLLKSPNQHSLREDLLAMVAGAQTVADGEGVLEWQLWGRRFRVRSTMPPRYAIDPEVMVEFLGSLVSNLTLAMDKWIKENERSAA
jgi:hypothetical protein